MPSDIFFIFALKSEIFQLATMTRKDFFLKVGFGTCAALLPACFGGIASSCSSSDASSETTKPPAVVDFNVDISRGTLATNGGFLVLNEIIIARTLQGDFLAVSVACTHQYTNVDFHPLTNNFICSNHGSQFTSTGAVSKGPAEINLKKYNTSLQGTILRVYS